MLVWGESLQVFQPSPKPALQFSHSSKVSSFSSHNLIFSVMPATNTPHRTHPSNATTQPGQIVLDVQIKRHTKAQKNADDLALKEVKEAQI